MSCTGNVGTRPSVHHELREVMIDDRSVIRTRGSAPQKGRPWHQQQQQQQQAAGAVAFQTSLTAINTESQLHGPDTSMPVLSAVARSAKELLKDVVRRTYDSTNSDFL